MQEVRKAMLNDGWVVCAKCGHKLGRVIGSQSPKGLEIKCHSCKELNIVDKPRKMPVKREKETTQYKYPHCCHCKNYKGFTDVCLVALMRDGLGSRAKPSGSRTCKSFEPKEEFKKHYKEMLK